MEEKETVKRVKVNEKERGMREKVDKREWYSEKVVWERQLIKENGREKVR